MVDFSTLQTSAAENLASPTSTVAAAVQKVEGGNKNPVQSGEGKPESVATGDQATQETKPKEDTTTERFGALARREQQALRERQAIAAEKQKLSAEQASFAAQKARFEEEDALWKANPAQVIEKRLGDKWYDVLTQIQLNEGRPTPDMVAKTTVVKELEAFKKAQEEEREAAKAEAQKAERAKFEQTLAEFRQEVQDFVKAPENQEAYELVNLHDASEVVLATIEEHFQRTKKAGKPQIMSITQACDLVEKYLEEQVERSTKTKKFSARVSPHPAPNGAKVEAKSPSEPVPPRTINNNLTSSAHGARPLSREERIARARALKL